MTKNKTYKIQTLGLDLYEGLDQDLVRDLQHELIEVQNLHSTAEETLEQIEDSFTAGDFESYSTEDKLRASADMAKYESRIEAIRKQLAKASNAKLPPPLDGAMGIAKLTYEAYRGTVPVYVMATDKYRADLAPKGKLPAVVVLPSKVKSGPSLHKIVYLRTPMLRPLSAPLLIEAAKRYGIKMSQASGPHMNSKLQHSDAVISAGDIHALAVGDEPIADTIEWLGRTPVVYEELPPVSEIDHDRLILFAKSSLNRELSAVGIRFDTDAARNHSQVFGNEEIRIDGIDNGVLKFTVHTALLGTEGLGGGETDAIFKRFATLPNESPQHVSGLGYAVSLRAMLLPSEGRALGASRWFSLTAEVVADPVAHRATRHVVEAA